MSANPDVESLAEREYREILARINVAKDLRQSEIRIRTPALATDIVRSKLRNRGFDVMPLTCALTKITWNRTLVQSGELTRLGFEERGPGNPGRHLVDFIEMDAVRGRKTIRQVAFVIRQIAEDYANHYNERHNPWMRINGIQPPANYVKAEYIGVSE